ncbi:hypothetical protein Smp_156330 [Schistosoma mansoni]|uniref:hypothetical protein n=1 Tax=Schistosoma mansoni TaxID=6183 RepID=UPI0001A640F1|nr:hypothetical protein Smp_156330 [Schistosoma mansoni]|eukprot:XP_018651198.1 hypothetical protein Smp_156330 [Schistosoma mansoni]
MKLHKILKKKEPRKSEFDRGNAGLSEQDKKDLALIKKTPAYQQVKTKVLAILDEKIDKFVLDQIRPSEEELQKFEEIKATKEFQKAKEKVIDSLSDRIDKFVLEQFRKNQ